MFGNPEVTTGGRALKFYSSVRLDVRRIESLKVSGEVVGNRTRVKVVKNKVAPPFREAEFDIMYGTGISRAGEIIDLGVKYGVVEKSGAWFSYGGERLGQGRDNVKELLRNDPALMEEIAGIIMDTIEASKEPEVPVEAPVKPTVKAPAPKAATAKKSDLVVSADDFE